MASTSSMNGHVNGDAHYTPEDSFERPSTDIWGSHNANILDHLYHAGFQTGNYSDTLLHVHQPTGHPVAFRLHAIILSRAPYLAHLMSTSQQGLNERVLYVQLPPEVTHEGFSIALGYLYSATSAGLVHEKNCRAVLASALLLGGMDDLSTYAYETCRRSISVDTIDDWLRFMDAIAPPSDGSSTPNPALSVLGPYAERLRNDVFTFLVVTLPQSLDLQADSDSKAGRDVLLQIFSRVPFDLFKTAVESSVFEIGSAQTRFKFAKDVIELRKRGIAAHGGEETVVLSNFGGSAIHITRKMRKRPLWKVNS
ncbi:BTB domain-containing protein [Mycena indigotica]|uniref:BTB domain-containing protein n=1 Tax=Mycena indigotica TaxID=2126181 RepID=A0A8H6S8U0_9AGAR|nr:BTB domain-containing protein [Mycena indigotica]KAF7295056.1 BTB domain-containing protein [Mycena indigotica]